jgi:hypothetical protein
MASARLPVRAPWQTTHPPYERGVDRGDVDTLDVEPPPFELVSVAGTPLRYRNPVHALRGWLVGGNGRRLLGNLALGSPPSSNDLVMRVRAVVPALEVRVSHAGLAVPNQRRPILPAEQLVAGSP